MSGISVRATGFVVFEEQEGGRRDAWPSFTGGSAIDEALTASEFRIAATLGVAPDADGRRDFAEPRQVQLDVPVAPGEDAVVLLEDASGALSWRFPDGGPGADARRSGWESDAELGPPAASVRRFTINSGESDDDPGRRSFIVDWVVDAITEPVRMRVLRFLAQRSIDRAIARIEGGLVSGPVVVGPGPAIAWAAGDIRHAKALLPAGRAARILLLVHGTFSSTAGSFAALADWLPFAGYDLVLGYDHRTLGEDPAGNAEAILAALHALDLPEGSEIEAIAYSRGGLVYRELVEALLPRAPLKARFTRAVFVGCTNGGTLLAEPDNWKSLLNIYTNVLVAGARLAVLATGAGAAAEPFVVAAIKTMGGFAQMLSQVAVTERRAPGLAAMEPDSEVVRRLNSAEPPADFATRYFAVVSNFEPGSTPGGLARAVALRTLDRLADRLYGVDNDLVVDTASMTRFGDTREAEEVVAAPSDDAVYHTIYFSAESTREAIARWLEMPAPYLAAAGDYVAAPMPDDGYESVYGYGGDAGAGELQRHQQGIGAAAPVFGAQGYGRVGAVAWNDYSQSYSGERRRIWGELTEPALIAPPPMPEPPSAMPPAAPWPAAASAGEAASQGATGAGRREDEGSASAVSPESGAPEATSHDSSSDGAVDTQRYLAAEMSPYPLLGRPTNLYVTVSPDPLVVPDHAAARASAEPVTLDARQVLTVHAIALSNCRVVGAEVQEVSLAQPLEEVVKFRVEGMAAGEACLRVEARQGTETAAFFELNPVFLAGRPAPLREVAPMPTTIATRNGRVVLRIYETRIGDYELRLKFHVSCDDPEFTELEEIVLQGGFDIGVYTRQVIKKVENAWQLRQAGSEQAIYDSFLEQLRADAVQRTRELVPEPVRRCLWKHRASIDEVHVMSSEPHIPWELMYLADPDGQERDGGCFYAEKGLVRWLHVAPLSRRRRNPDEGAKRFVIPAGKDPATRLKGAEREKAMLAGRFPDAVEVPATSADVRKFLREEAKDCAILHFACHGRTLENAVIESELLMRTLPAASGKSFADALTWQDVATNADFGPDGGPLVFVNACQTGQQGDFITGGAGFARAFLRPDTRRGAAAFIGALWSVDDALAQSFAGTVYDELAKGARLTDAVRAARLACQTSNDFTWLAYTVFAND